MNLPLAVGLLVVIVIAITIICSVIVSGLQQKNLIEIAQQQNERQKVSLNEFEANLLSEMRSYWLRDKILPATAQDYNVILMPDRKLIITLNRPLEASRVIRTGWLVLELTANEVEQNPVKNVELIQEYLENPRQMNSQRATLHNKQKF